jgi:hypothetical protein
MTSAVRVVAVLLAGLIPAVSGCTQQDPTAIPTASGPPAAATGEPSRSAGPTDPATPTDPAPSAERPTGQPLYYAFAFDADPDSPGCGPQARFVKVDGSDFYQVAGFGCDASADRGTISADQVELVGTVHRCGGEGLETYPSTMTITGGPQDLRIPGETRVVGPTTDPAELDLWWSEENEQVPNPSPRDATHVTEWMRQAAADDWIGNGC